MHTSSASSSYSCERLSFAKRALSDAGSGVDPLALAGVDPSLAPGKGTRACSSGLIGEGRAAAALLVAVLLAIDTLPDLAAALDVLINIAVSALLFFFARRRWSLGWDRR